MTVNSVSVHGDVQAVMREFFTYIQIAFLDPTHLCFFSFLFPYQCSSGANCQTGACNGGLVCNDAGITSHALLSEIGLGTDGREYWDRESFFLVWILSLSSFILPIIFLSLQSLTSVVKLTFLPDSPVQTVNKSTVPLETVPPTIKPSKMTTTTVPCETLLKVVPTPTSSAVKL